MSRAPNAVANAVEQVRKFNEACAPLLRQIKEVARKSGEASRAFGKASKWEK